ncbi:SusC/RagA family TonB-linked outer membrane protein [Saccharicrinis aurantiacus]|uniref:SusC/RagA family TonB-linked outer membrane protein n=1 Tax=Saccharicrinis aurantiacus TaxID=1849719 RepID=UPI00249107A7|nr:SusC/RagA family TonB-linked outer membrane protein [Saccharicrinis aurantiacus]
MKHALLFILILISGTLMAQKSVNGTIISTEDGSSLPGVNVIIKGTTTGTISDIDGKYVLEVPDGESILQFSFIGYDSQEIQVANQSTINVQLAPSAVALEGVIVTALGIEKKSRGLTYSAQQLDGDALGRAKDANMVNALAGKSAGVIINKSASGVGGSAKVTIRGNRSATGNNQPLYVIDGIPMINSSGTQPATSIGGTNDAGARDGGDGIGNLNPDDIASMTILKGASAAALYGSSAANGVVVITTKKGKSGKPVVNFSSNLTFDKAIETPDFQNSYGVSEGGRSWGSAINGGHDNVDEFFQTGYTAINSLSISSGTEKFQSYYSYANTNAEGIIGGNKLNKHNINIRQTANLYNGKLQLDGNVNLVNQKVENRPTPGGYYFNPLVGLYRYPRGEDISQYKDEYKKYDVGRNFDVQNWHQQPSSWEQNPWWLTNMVPSEDVRNRVIASITAKWNIKDYLNFQVRMNSDNTFDQYDQHVYATTATELVGGDYNNGRYITSNRHESLSYGDALLNFNKEVAPELTLVASLGASITDMQLRYNLKDSRPDGLEVANVFNQGNMLGAGYIEEINSRTQMQSLFATAQLGWKNGLFFDVTGRNDWSSTLAYTDSKTSGFFYPSVGLTAVLSEFIAMPDAIDFLKVRGSLASVGNSIPFGISHRTHTMGAGGSLIFNGNAPFDNLKPEISQSKEAGFEVRFLENLFTFDFTWYQTNTINQFFQLPAPAGSGYTTYFVNAGDIKNHGVEVVLGVNPINTADITWQNNFNYSHNRNKVVELHPDMKAFNFGNQTSSSYWMRMEEGGAFGDIYGKVYERDEAGNIQYDAETGLPLVGSEFGKIANSNPDFNLSWNSDFRYKNFSLGFLIDSRIGGDVVSLTQADLDQYGVTAATGSARDKGYVMLEGTKINDVQGFYEMVGGRDGVSEQYVYSATNIRLRELSLSYNLPSTWMEKTNFLDRATVSVIGRNLFFFYNEAPFDPDATLSTGNDLQGVDVFGMPTTQSLGFNLKLTF